MQGAYFPPNLQIARPVKSVLKPFDPPALNPCPESSGKSDPYFQLHKLFIFLLLPENLFTQTQNLSTGQLGFMELMTSPPPPSPTSSAHSSSEECPSTMTETSASSSPELAPSPSPSLSQSPFSDIGTDMVVLLPGGFGSQNFMPLK